MRRRPAGRALAARLLALAILLAGFADLVSALSPQRSDLATLLEDVRHGRTGRVQVYDAGAGGTAARWSTGWGRRSPPCGRSPGRQPRSALRLSGALRLAWA